MDQIKRFLVPSSWLSKVNDQTAETEGAGTVLDHETVVVMASDFDAASARAMEVETERNALRKRLDELEPLLAQVHKAHGFLAQCKAEARAAMESCAMRDAREWCLSSAAELAAHLAGEEVSNNALHSGE